MLDKENAIEIEKKMRKKYGPRYTYIFICKHTKCNLKIKVRSDALKTSKGLCKMHTQQKKPFESIYNSLFNDHRKIEVKLTYSEFVEFTKNNLCVYCHTYIKRDFYGTVKGCYKSRAYYLDRKDHSKGYSKENCVTCCTRCNRARGNRFTYKEWLGMTSYLRNLCD